MSNSVIRSISASESKHQVQGRFLLDVVVAQGSSILQLLSSEDESLLIRGDSFLVLDLGLDVLDRVASLDIKGDSFSGQCLDENLHDCVFYCLLVSGCIFIFLICFFYLFIFF